jgi:hypothetical protein
MNNLVLLETIPCSVVDLPGVIHDHMDQLLTVQPSVNTSEFVSEVGGINAANIGNDPDGNDSVNDPDGNDYIVTIWGYTESES